MNQSQHTLNANIRNASHESRRHSSDTSSESFETAISFVRIGSDEPQELTNPREIQDLPAIHSGSLQEYYINTTSELNWEIRQSDDYEYYTSKLKIIGAPTDDPKRFTDLLIAKNRWLKLEYLYIDQIYKTETSFRNSFNYIVSIDNAAFQQINDFGQLNFGKCRCTIHHYIAIESCTRCHSYNHDASECKEKITCKLCAKQHHHSECTEAKENHSCINCQRANLTGANYQLNHRASYGGKQTRLKFTEFKKKEIEALRSAAHRAEN